MTQIKIKRLTETATLPSYGTPGAAGMDLHADLGATKQVLLGPGERLLVKTGIAIALPIYLEAQVRARSGLALKAGIGLVNGIGTIDSDYRGDIGVILLNTSHQQFVINHGDRIAQLVISPVLQVDLEEVEDLDDTGRGSGGFGSTGVSATTRITAEDIKTASLPTVTWPTRPPFEPDADAIGVPLNRTALLSLRALSQDAYDRRKATNPGMPRVLTKIVDQDVEPEEAARLLTH